MDINKHEIKGVEMNKKSIGVLRNIAKLSATVILISTLSACSTAQPEAAQIVKSGAPTLAVALTGTLTNIVSQQRLSALSASRLYGYTFFAAQEAFQSEMDLGNKEEKLAVIAAVHAATSVAKSILSGAKLPSRELEALERRYASNPDGGGKAAKSRGIKTAEKFIERAKVDGFNEASDAPQPKIEDTKWDWEPTGTMRMPFIEPGYGNVKPLVESTVNCTLPSPSLPTIKEESIKLFENFDPASAANEEVLLFLAGNGTPTPPGQMLVIAANSARSTKMDESSSMNFISAIAIAGNDAGIAVWREKSKHMLARPETIYFRETGKQVQLPRETPAHPSYPSGHSGFSGSAVEIMNTILGSTAKMKIVAPEDLAAPRVVFEFTSPDTLLKAVSSSRVSAGFHTKTDVIAGESLGKCVGQTVYNALQKLTSRGDQK